MILVDTSVWIDFFKDKDTRETELLGKYVFETHLIIGDLIMLELLQGVRSDSEFDRLKKALDNLDFALLGGYKTTLSAAKNYRILRTRGVTVRKTMDVLIASYCIEHNHQLLHSDRDFDAFAQHLPLRIV